MITYDFFAQVEIQIATVLSAEPVPKTEKLMVLQVSLGDEIRPIVAGIQQHYTPESIVGKQIAVVVNLAPAKIRGIESHGMLLAASDETGALALLTPDKPVSPGSKVK